MLFSLGKPALSKQDTGTFPKATKGVTFTLEKSQVHEIPAKPKRTPKVHCKSTKNIKVSLVRIFI